MTHRTQTVRDGSPAGGDGWRWVCECRARSGVLFTEQEHAAQAGRRHQVEA
jgi:hypothetical protein